MTSTMAITLVITAVMAVLFLWGKFPFGLVTISCTLALVATGVLTLQEGFAGLVSQTVILVASMFAMAGALQKTDLPYKMQGLMGTLKGKSHMALMFAIIIVYLVTTTVLPAEVMSLLILSFVMLLPKENEVTPSRVILPMMMLGACWAFAVPVGLGATMDFTANVYMEGIVTDSEQLFQLGDLFLMRLIPTAAAVIYCLLIWRKIPNEEVNLENVSSGQVKKSDLPMWKQMIVYLSFVAVIIVMLFSSYFGSLMFYLPAIFACVFGFLGILNHREIIANVASDIVWMLGGILGVTAALTKSGAASVLGEALLPLISWTDNSFVIILIICAFTAIMTTFLSNMGTMGVLCPLVASMAMAAGMDPRSLVAAVMIGSMYAFCFPSGSTTCAFFFAMGKYNPIKIMKYTLPLLALLILTTAISITIFFPPFG